MDVKRVFACAALLAGLLFFNGRLSAAVESDIVGYTTMTMEAGKWYQVGTPFATLDGSASLSVNDVFSGGLVAGDTLMILDTNKGQYKAQYFWVPEKNDGKGAWCDLPVAAIATPVNEMLVPGQAVYIHKSTATEVIFSGQVKPVEVSFGSESGNAWNQVAAVWPERRALNDITWSGLKTGDTLMILDSSKGAYKNQLFWVPEKNAWCNLPIAAIATPSTEVLEPGQAVFINKVSQGTGTLITE